MCGSEPLSVAIRVDGSGSSGIVGSRAGTCRQLWTRVGARTGAVSARLTGQSVALIIKKRARAAGLDPHEFAGHSLRSGYATQAARDGHHPTQIAATTRHQDQRVLAGYIRAGRGKDDVAHVL
jgi:hypothetical protein